METTGKTHRSDPKRGRTLERSSNICIFDHKNKKYRVDSNGFLLFPQDWDEDFAEGKALVEGISGGLTDRHWKVLWFIRNNFERINQCPIVYVACKKNQLGLGELSELFPMGYLRGACKLAGVTYREAYLQHMYLEENGRHLDYLFNAKTYAIDVRGFLVKPEEWDEYFALNKAHEMKYSTSLTDEHFRIINYLRDRFMKNRQVPTVIETCDDLKMDWDELERLFPDGYHRGAVKIAGLRVR